MNMLGASLQRRAAASCLASMVGAIASLPARGAFVDPRHSLPLRRPGARRADAGRWYCRPP